MPESSPGLPNTIVQMFAAVPRSCGTRSRRRYSRARSVFHDDKTASVARSSCSRGSCMNGRPVCAITIDVNV